MQQAYHVLLEIWINVRVREAIHPRTPTSMASWHNRSYRRLRPGVSWHRKNISFSRDVFM